MYMPKPRRIPW